MKKKFSSYKFWVSLSAAIIIFLKAVGKMFNFTIDGEVIDGMIMGICGILVVLGFVNKDEDGTDEKQNDENKTKDDEKK